MSFFHCVWISREIAPVRNSHLVRVSWVSPDPVLSAEIANNVVDSYIAFSLESGYQTSDQASEFLVDQVAGLKREIAELEFHRATSS